MDRERWTDARTIEFFHLAFLQVAQARLAQAQYVLKGGTNLRYFFASDRYSEDIDLDAVGIAAWTLEDKVDELLRSQALATLLRSAGVTAEEITKPKQTETTQRWKLLLAVGGRRAGVRTRIEFSHRDTDQRRILEAVPDRVVAPYALRPPSSLHYTAAAAIEQKTAALAERSTTQARDVFDLELLLRQQGEAADPLEIDPLTLEAALERLSELPNEAFADQVLPFLDPEMAELYRGPNIWDEMKSFVARRLMELR